MGTSGWIIRIASYCIIGIGLGLLALNIFWGGSLNIALPLVFLMLGGAFAILARLTRQAWGWSGILYIPGLLLVALGLIFLLNLLTNDWNAWAYAWLLMVAGAGVGLALASRQQAWPRALAQAGWMAAIASVSLFAIFGAIAGGLFIQVAAPILLVLGGLSLRWLRLESILPEALLKRLRRSPQPGAAAPAAPDQSELVEPLSARELEVLRLVDQGLSNQQIAAKLSVAPSTVKTHINNIYGKLGAQTRVQAIHRARELKLME